MAAPEEVTVWIGLDVGKEEHYADVLDDDGDGLFHRSVINDEADLDALIARAASLGQPAVVIDRPGSIAQLAIALAARRGVPVAYVPGLVMRRAADLYPGEAKTDRRDAFVLADTARMRRRQVHWLDTGSDELLDQLRVLNGFDVDLAADLTRLTNRLRDALTSISPALERALGSRLARAGVRDLLARFPTPTALRQTGRTRINKVIRARSPRLAAKLTDTVLAALDAQTVTPPAEATVGRVIAELAVELGRVHERRDNLAREIEEGFLAHPFDELLATLSEIGDGARFANGSKLASYAALALITRESGTSLKGESKSRRGNHRLKNAMFLAAFAFLRDPESRAFYDRNRAEGKKHNAAVMCLARRRCDVILGMLRNQQPYLTPAEREAARNALAA